MGVRTWWREWKRRKGVRLNSFFLRRLARYGGKKWMAAYMAQGPAIALVLTLAFLFSKVVHARLLLHDPALIQRSNGWLILVGLPIAILAAALTLLDSWSEARQELKERPRRKKLRRDYDRTLLKQTS